MVSVMRIGARDIFQGQSSAFRMDEENLNRS